MRLSGFTYRTPLYIAVAGILLLTSSGAFNRLVAQVNDNNANGNKPPAGAAAAADPATEAAAGKTLGNELFKMPSTLAEWVAILFYAILLVFSLVAATIIAERLFNLKQENVMPGEFARKLLEATSRRRDSQSQLRALAESSDTPIGRVLKAAVFRGGRPWAEVEKGMDDEMTWEMAALRGRHRALTGVASVAPLVGLLGTVIGMIFAFMVTSEETAAGRQAAELGRGIYLALFTTAAGLTIAIPCMLFAARFNARVDRYIRQMNETLLSTMNSFVRMEQAAAQQRRVETTPATDEAVRAMENGDAQHHGGNPDDDEEAIRVPLSAK